MGESSLNKLTRTRVPQLWCELACTRKACSGAAQMLGFPCKENIFLNLCHGMLVLLSQSFAELVLLDSSRIVALQA